MADFNTYYPKLLVQEGGYASADLAKSINDKGGETYLGIARNYNPTWAGWPIIDKYKADHGTPAHNAHIPDANLDALAKSFSKSHYWDVLDLDQVKNQSIAEYIMDFGFNSGLANPIIAVQKILGLSVDGKVGPNTINAINSANPQDLFNKLKDYRVQFVARITSLPANVKAALTARANSFGFSNVVIAIKNNPVKTGVIIGFFLLGGFIIYKTLIVKN